MRRGARIAVVIPARDEARFIGEVLATLPTWVDCAIVVDDGSNDDTGAIAGRTDCAPLVVVLRHDEARGVGAAIIAGYRQALAGGMDVTAVMAGDGQMDPDDLAAIVDPVVRGDAGYVKGDRTRHPQRRAMPPVRRWGSSGFAALTSWATGVRVRDSQCGYTAVHREALEAIALDRVWQGYGYPNDLIARFAEAGVPIAEVPVRPVYRDESSGLRPWHALTITRLVLAARLRRRR